MSAPSTSSTALAAVCIVDSSLAVAIEWGRIFSDYLAPIIQRLAELTSNVNQVMSQTPSHPQPLHSPSTVQDRLHYIWPRILSSFTPSLSAFLPAIRFDEQGDEGRVRKVLYRSDWHWIQFRRHGCPRGYCRCARGIHLRPTIILSLPEAKSRRCLTSSANQSAFLSVNPRYNSRTSQL